MQCITKTIPLNPCSICEMEHAKWLRSMRCYAKLDICNMTAKSIPRQTFSCDIGSPTPLKALYLIIPTPLLFVCSMCVCYVGLKNGSID